MRSKLKNYRWFLLLQCARTTLGSRIPGITPESLRANYAPVMRSLSKRDASSKSVYIGILSGVLGAIVILTVGVCWNIQRKRLASKRRELEEARHPRDPMSYRHFPVRPGDDVDEADESGEGIEGCERDEGREGRTRDVSEPVAAPIRSYPTMMSVVPHQQALTLSHGIPQLPQLPHAPHGMLRSTMPSHLLPLRSSIEREGVDIPQYEEAAALPPPFFDNSIMIHPPGLGEDGHLSTRPSISSRPVTASAPPAYTPSDTGHMTSSSHSHSQSHEPELEGEDEHEHRHEHGHDGQLHARPLTLTEAPADPLNPPGRSISPS